MVVDADGRSSGITGYRHDIFISYASVDDTAITAGSHMPGDGWVTTFLNKLQAALIQRLGGDRPAIYFDRSRLGPNHLVDRLLDEVRHSALFVAVGSPAYARRDFTQRELQTFVAGSPDPERLFAVECLPLDAGETYPDPLARQKRLQFWARNEPVSTVAVSDDPASPGFLQKIHDLAEQLKRAIRELQAKATVAAASRARTVAAPGGPGGPLRPVVLARVTDDLDDSVADLRRYLGQYDIPVIPEDDWPLEPGDFQAAFRQALVAPAIFVQLLGPYRGKAPKSIPEGLLAWQHNAAVAAGLTVRQWRHPKLDLATVIDAEHQRLLTGPHVLAEGFESFKAGLVAATKPAPAALAAANDAVVFVDAQDCDAAIAEKVLQRLADKGIDSSMLTEFGEPSIRAQLRERYELSDAVCWIYGEADRNTLNGRISVDFQRINKMRKREGRPFRALAVYKTPPPGKPGLGVAIANLIEIEASDADFPAAFDQFIESLG